MPDTTEDRPPTWRLSPARSIVLDRPRLLAILNATPDSFYGASRLGDAAAAADAAARAVAEGADAIDLGAESTRPGAEAVPPPQQIARLVPVLRAIRSLPAVTGDIPITVDTTSAAVAKACIDEGADAINDVSAGTDDPDMLPLAAGLGRGIILMHRLKLPRSDSYSDRYATPPVYDDVVASVGEHLRERADAALRAGIEADAIVLDPGLGFGKTVEQNLALIDQTPRIRGIAAFADRPPPLLSGLSRKSFVGRVSLGRDSEPAERLEGTLALSVAHFIRGAVLFRVHDVAAHRRALDAVAALSPIGSTSRRGG